MNVVVAGAAGRMGRAILAALRLETDLALVAALEREGHPTLGQDAGTLAGGEPWGVVVDDRPKKTVSRGDVVIDFSHPTCTLMCIATARRENKPMVIGTTGFSEGENALIQKAARKIPIVLSPNMGIGVNVLYKLIAEAAAALGPAYDAEIVETHHRDKKDAPSGTALRMGEVIAHARGTTLARVGRFARHGVIGPRADGEIGVMSLRAGDVVGAHTVLFAGPGERIELAHHAHSRDYFARGALRAARWIVGQTPGCYTMMDVLNLQTK